MLLNTYPLFEKKYFWKWGTCDVYLKYVGEAICSSEVGGIHKCSQKWGDTCTAEGPTNKSCLFHLP